MAAEDYLSRFDKIATERDKLQIQLNPYGVYNCWHQNSANLKSYLLLTNSI